MTTHLLRKLLVSKQDALVVVNVAMVMWPKKRMGSVAVKHVEREAAAYLAWNLGARASAIIAGVFAKLVERPKCNPHGSFIQLRSPQD